MNRARVLPTLTLFSLLALCTHLGAGQEEHGDPPIPGAEEPAEHSTGMPSMKKPASDPTSGSAHPSLSQDEADETESSPGPRRNVLLVHGIFDSSKKFRALSKRLESRGYHTVAIDLEPADAKLGLDHLARQVEERVAESFGEEPFALVGFSMGGLICRAYLQKLMEEDTPLVAFATISTPHKGSLWGWVHPSKGARQMRPESPWLRELNAEVDVLDERPFLSIWSPLDLMIVPSDSSRIGPGEESIHWVPAHPLMLFNRKVADRLADFLDKAFAEN